MSKARELLESMNEGVPEKHQLKIALKTLKMNKVGASVMGGMDHKGAVKVLRKNGYSDDKIKGLLKKAGHSEGDIDGFMGESSNKFYEDFGDTSVSLNVFDYFKTPSRTVPDQEMSLMTMLIQEIAMRRLPTLQKFVKEALNGKGLRPGEKHLLEKIKAKGVEVKP